MFYQIQGNLYLIGGVPFNSDYVHTLDFDNPTQQQEYFASKVIYDEGTVTHVKKDQPVKVARNIEALYGVNYVMYRNYTNTRWIYAFITDKQYINEGCTALTIETDVFQTYLFDYAWNETFIEREHASRWAGVNVPVYSYTDEGLTLGDEYVKENEKTIASCAWYYLVCSTVQLENPDAYSSPNEVNAHPTPLYYYILYNYTQGALTMLANEPAIISISLLPFPAFSISALQSVTYTDIETQLTCTLYRITSNVALTKTYSNINPLENLSMPSTFGTGIARNKIYESKLLCYPYSFSKLTQYQGAEMLVKHEYLSPQVFSLNVTHNISHDLKYKCYISSGYKGESNGKENSLINTTVNELPLVTDYYKNYIMQNRASIMSGYALAGLEVAGAVGGAVLTGGLSIPLAAGVAGSAISSIAGELSKQKDLQTTPNAIRQMGNNIAFDVADANLYIKLVRLSVNDTIKSLLADFWAMYGYKCSRLKTPDTRSRYYYNYIKTINCNITGNIEGRHMEKLKNIFNNGVTIWHYRAGVTPLSYEYDNVEVTLL